MKPTKQELLEQLAALEEEEKAQQQEDLIEDAEFTEVKEEKEEPKIITMINLGYREDGSVIFTVNGEGNLLAIEGLIKYAEREVGKLWASGTKNNEVEDK